MKYWPSAKYYVAFVY